MAAPSVILIGYGNPGRLDDGLGPALAARIEQLRLPSVAVESAYQLVVEDAAAVAEYDIAIFADAATDAIRPWYFRQLEPAADFAFSTHALTPAAVLGLAHDLFGARTAGYLLGIRGHAFNAFGEGLSPEARTNLTLAVAFLADRLIRGDFPEAVTEGASAAAEAPAFEVELCRTERK